MCSLLLDSHYQIPPFALYLQDGCCGRECLAWNWSQLCCRDYTSTAFVPRAHPHLYKLLTLPSITATHHSLPFATFPSFPFLSLSSLSFASQFSPIFCCPMSFMHHNLATDPIYYLGKPSTTRLCKLATRTSLLGCSMVIWRAPV